MTRLAPLQKEASNMLLQIDITNRCNLKCPFCRRQKDKTDALGEKDIFIILSEAREYGFRELNISGGEPFLHQGIYRIVKKANELGYGIITITTNGTLPFRCDDAKLISLLKTVTLIQVSIDDIQEHHDRLRGMQGAYERSLEFAHFAQKYTKTVIKSVVTKNNLPRIVKLKNILKDRGFNAYSIRPLIPSDKSGFDSTLSYDDFKNLYLELSTDKDMIVVSEDPLFNTFCPFIPQSEFGNLGGCLAGIDVLYINSEGEVYPCAYLKTKVGDIRSQSLEDIFNHPTMTALRSRKLEGRCGNCRLRLFCGGCRAFAYENSNGNFMAEDFRCGMV